MQSNKPLIMKCARCSKDKLNYNIKENYYCNKCNKYHNGNILAKTEDIYQPVLYEAILGWMITIGVGYGIYKWIKSKKK